MTIEISKHTALQAHVIRNHQGLPSLDSSTWPNDLREWGKENERQGCTTSPFVTALWSVRERLHANNAHHMAGISFLESGTETRAIYVRDLRLPLTISCWKHVGLSSDPAQTP